MSDIKDEVEKPDRSCEHPSQSTIERETGRIAAEASDRQSALSVLDAFSADPQDEDLQRALDELFHEILSRPRDTGWREIDW